MRLWAPCGRRDIPGVLGFTHRARIRLAARGPLLPPVSVRALADAAAPAAAAAIGLGRLVALVAAEAPADRLALGLVLWAFLVALLLSALRRWTTYPGELALAFVAIHEVGCGWLEFLRAPAPDPFYQGLAFAIAAAAGGLLVAGHRASTAPRR
jgi:hypothetical protein